MKQQTNPGEISACAWDLEHNGTHGLRAAFSNLEMWGGHVFISTTEPGYVAWFDPSYDLPNIEDHAFVRGHEGITV